MNVKDELTDICQQPVWDENPIKTSFTILKRIALWQQVHKRMGL